MFRSRVLHVADTLIVLFILYPPMVFYWRGIWDLWGVYIQPGPYPTAKWYLILISSACYGGYFIGPIIDRKIASKSYVTKRIIIIIFLNIYGALFFGYWRAVWETLDFYFSPDPVQNLIVMLASYSVLVFLRCSRSCIIPPMYASLDTREGVLIPNTRFKTKVSCQSPA